MQTIEMETYDFPTMRRKNRIYVDKTGQFHELITGNTSLHFVARPRRFGKSLMISTLDCIFRGRNYAEPFRGHGLPLYAIGLAFDPKSHRLVDTAAEAL